MTKSSSGDEIANGYSPPDERVPLSVNFPRMSRDGQGTKWRRNIVENFNQLSRAHERYRQATDGCATPIHVRLIKRSYMIFANFMSAVKCNGEPVTCNDVTNHEYKYKTNL